ncbi:MAG: hypothetical protein K0R21_617 [Anaerocolumna sp.]|nr:hypothetical protein [Anaerocolumna sp.]
MPGIPLIFISIVMLSLLLSLYISRSGQKSKMDSRAFWEKESRSNSTRKADISNLDYIKISLSRLPLVDTTDDELHNIQEAIRELAEKPILNLTGISNTDLKLKYGAANMTFLSECDSNYTLLVRSLYKWASYLNEHNLKKEAVSVLEYAVECKTDISKNYILLAALYKEIGEDEKINDLLLTVMTLQSLTKDSIITALKELP